MSYTTTITRPSTAKPVDSAPTTVPLPSNNKLYLKIDDKWYDLTTWQHQHPGGTHILHNLNGQDATDAFHALHSKGAKKRLERLGGSNKTPQGCVEPQPSPATLAFRKFRSELVQEGWFDRNLAWEFVYAASVYVFAALGTYFAMSGSPILSMLCIALSMNQAAWVGHDYMHGHDYESVPWKSVTAFSTMINGMSQAWWNRKHNMHHVYTNHVGVDIDINTDPLLHLYTPEEINDVWYRKYQHIYYPFLFSLLFFSWRIQSHMAAIRNKVWIEVIGMSLNYVWLFGVIGWQITIPAIFIAGFSVAFIVTATHQSEEMLPNDRKPYSFSETQFLTSRDARCPNELWEFLWGGMQYQLEHHLFPTMPRYYYRFLAPKLESFAARNNLTYRVDPMWSLWLRNHRTYTEYAQCATANKRADMFKLRTNLDGVKYD